MSRSTVWVQRARGSLIEAFGNACEDCGQMGTLEFAHKEPTECVGQGRGSYWRMRDVREFPDKYRLLCQACHAAFDGLLYRNRYAYKK